MKYEVRVLETDVNYYRLEADNEEQAKARVLEQVNNPKGLIYATKVDTIKRTPIVNYAVQVSPEGEVII